MKKIFWLYGPLMFTLSACSQHDASYYTAHPKALQHAMLRCPAHSASHLSCDELKVVALRINQLAYKLRMDQQAYGKEILALQEKQNDYQKKLQENPNEPQLKQALQEINQKIQERLSVVQWLESPRSVA